MLAPVVTGRRLDDRDDLAAAASAVQRAVARNFGAKAAVDAALHDLVAQAEGASVAAVLAARPDGIRDVLTTDVTLSAGAADALADTARARVADGFRTLKMKVGTDAATDVQRVAAVREAVGPDVAIRLDANQGWTPRRGGRRSSGRSRSPTSGSSSSSSRSSARTSRVWPGCASASGCRSWPTSRSTAWSTSTGSSGCGRPTSSTSSSPSAARSRSAGDSCAAPDAGLGTMVGSMMETPRRGGRRGRLVAAEPTDRGQRPGRRVVVGAFARGRRNRLRRQPDSRAHVGGLRDHGFRSARLTRRCTTKGPAGAGPFVVQERGQLPTTRSVKVPSPLPVVEELTPTARRDSRNVFASPSICPLVSV